MAAWHRHSRCIVNEFYSRGQSGWYKINAAIKTFGHGAALIDRRDDSFLQIDQFSADRLIYSFGSIELPTLSSLTLLPIYES